MRSTFASAAVLAVVGACSSPADPPPEPPACDGPGCAPIVEGLPRAARAPQPAEPQSGGALASSDAARCPPPLTPDTCIAAGAACGIHATACCGSCGADHRCCGARGQACDADHGCCGALRCLPTCTCG